MFYTICEKGAYFRIQRLIFYLSVFKIEISNRDAKTIHLNLNFQKSGVRNMGLNVTVSQKAISLSPLAYGIVGIMGLVVIGLVVLLIKAKRKK